MKKRSFIIGMLSGVVVVCLGVGVTGLINRDFIGYMAGHGRIVIDAPNFYLFAYAEVLSVHTAESYQSDLVVPSGEYSVVVYLEDTATEPGIDPVVTQYAAAITVGGWLQPTVVKPVTRIQSFEKVMGSVSNQLIPLDTGHYLTYDKDHVPKTNFADGRTLSYEEIYSACYVGSSQILLLGDAGANVYDITTRTLAPYESDSFDLMAVPAETLKSARCVKDAAQFVYGGSMVRLDLESVEVIGLPDRVAKGRRGLLADVAGDTVAVIVGNDYPNNDPDPLHVEGSLGGSQLVVTNRDISVVSRLDLDNWDYVVDVALSPDGSRVAVQVDEFISFYDSETAELLYVTPSYSDQTFWIDNNSLIYRTDPGAGSVFISDIAKRESFSLNNTERVAIGTVSSLVDGYLYLTCYGNDDYDLVGYRLEVK
jgi:hypothetical protein